MKKRKDAGTAIIPKDLHHIRGLAKTQESAQKFAIAAVLSGGVDY